MGKGELERGQRATLPKKRVGTEEIYEGGSW